MEKILYKETFVASASNASNKAPISAGFNEKNYKTIKIIIKIHQHINYFLIGNEMSSNSTCFSAQLYPWPEDLHQENISEP